MRLQRFCRRRTPHPGPLPASGARGLLLDLVQYPLTNPAKILNDIVFQMRITR
jgi:hypothetical protein